MAHKIPSSRALCQLEKRVHSNGFNPKDQAMMMLELPRDAVVLNVNDLGLPSDWRDDEAITQKIGMSWLMACTSLALLVPSYIEPLENNVLINPAHDDYQKVTLTVEKNPFFFDPRLYD